MREAGHPEKRPGAVTEPPDDGSLEYTGERMVPEKADSATFWEHIYRYRFAAEFVRDKRVLDIACGEGYGTAALLRAGAASVVGIDVSSRACAHARRKYGVDARVGDVRAIPLPNRSIDIVVSYETLEHVTEPALFLNECLRVLAPMGRLIMSTPNRDVFQEAGRHNDFHCSELNPEEFMALLAPCFERVELYSQCPLSAAWWSPSSLAASRSPWLRIKGSWRVRELLRALLCPHVRGDVKARWRQSPVDAVLVTDLWLSRLVNFFCVRRWSVRSHERPLYIIAVADKFPEASRQGPPIG